MKCRFRILSFLLALLLLSSPVVSASADTPMPIASQYLASYNAYVCPMGDGLLRLYFHVMGTGDLDELGSLRIVLYESIDNEDFYWVDTFTHENYPNMLAYNDYFYESYVSYQGVAGRYYKFYICIWGGRDGDGDTRYFWTPSERAT